MQKERSLCRGFGGASVHCKTSSVSDYFAQDELHALALGRNIIKNLHMDGKYILGKGLLNVKYEYQEPLYGAIELRCIASTDLKQQFDIQSVIDQIVDGSEFNLMNSKIYMALLL
ncbi:hypothetical protein K1719_027971 [Acacia pycnantha]|nr:hypothetical protein K1719_027971 [Acacia pycnantha]